MKKPFASILVLLTVALAEPAVARCTSFLDHDVRKLRSDDRINLCTEFAGKPLLIVNTASYCGFTPQFEGLEALHRRYKDRGLAVLGVPSNDFRQAARDEETAAQICFVNYGVTFTMLSEQKVRGPDAHPLFVELARQAGSPRWNFTKYLLDGQGNVVKRFDSTVDPMSRTMVEALESVL